MYINDLCKELNNAQCGIEEDGLNVSNLLYADDIVLLSDSPKGLQTLLNVLYSWSETWKLEVNLSKTKIVHYRQGPKTPQTDFSFTYGDNTVEVCPSYKYLGLVLNEFLDYGVTCKTIAQSASRALGLLIAKCKAYGGMPYECYTKLYHS